MDDRERARYGVAGFDQAWYHVSVKLAAKVTSKKQIVARLKRESEALVDLLRATDINQSSDPVKVARLVGMEPISCDWSLLMIAEHLTLFISDVTKLVDALIADKPMRGSFSDEQHDPVNDVGVEIIDYFEESVDRLIGLIENIGKLNRGGSFRHSWLGRMNAHQWCAWSATHVGIHRRHAQKILSVSGVV